MTSLRDQLAGIARDAGQLTPETVVEAATPEEHPLHSSFEWDDTIAGHKYRLVQASRMIRTVRVVYTTDERGREHSVRAFTAVRGENAANPARAVYKPTEEVLENPLSTQILLRELQRELDQLKAKYGHLAAYAEILQDAASAA